MEKATPAGRLKAISCLPHWPETMGYFHGLHAAGNISRNSLGKTGQSRAAPRFGAVPAHSVQEVWQQMCSGNIFWPPSEQKGWHIPMMIMVVMVMMILSLLKKQIKGLILCYKVSTRCLIQTSQQSYYFLILELRKWRIIVLPKVLHLLSYRHKTHTSNKNPRSVLVTISSYDLQRLLDVWAFHCDYFNLTNQFGCKSIKTH